MSRTPGKPQTTLCLSPPQATALCAVAFLEINSLIVLGLGQGVKLEGEEITATSTHAAVGFAVSTPEVRLVVDAVEKPGADC